MTASVQAGGQPVTVGTVNFFDGKLYLGSAQVVRNAAHGYGVGTATVKMALRVGTHSIVATFLPTATLASSSSPSQTVTITGTAATSVALASAAGSGNSTVLTATLSASGASNPTGSVLFQNQTSNTAVGTVALAATTFTSSFSPVTPFSSTQPVSVYALDLNGDGFPDVLAIQDQDFRAASLQSYISGGDGTFKAAAEVPHYPPGAFSPPVIADYNGDGIPDLAFATNTNFYADPALGDPYEYEMVMFPGAGDGTFPNVETLIPAPSTGLTLNFPATGDFNGDGIPDLTVTDTTSATSPIFYIFPGKGDGTFATPVTNPGLVGVTSLVVQDFNGDGFADLAVTLSNQSAVLILLGKGDGTFQSAVSYPAGTNPIIATTLQSRGNGITDLAILSQADNSLGVLVGKGDGTFLPEVTYPLNVAGEQPIHLIAADVTGDGLQDIVALYSSTVPDPYVSAYAVVAGNGDGTYRPLVSYGFTPSSLTPSSISSADFNRDGTSDLVVPNPGGYTINVFLSSLQASVPLTATVYGTGTQQIVAQYSGDSNYSSSTSSVVSVTGAGPAPTPTFTLAANPSSLSIAAGMTGTATLSVTPQNGFNSPVTFSCSGLPANSSCSFSPSSVTPGGAAATTTLTIATNVQAAANEVPAKARRSAVISFALLIGFIPFAGVRFVRKSRVLSSTGDRFWMFLFCAGTVALTTALVVGCSGSGGSPTQPRTPPGTSSVTVDAIQSGSSGASAKAVLTVAITN